MAKKIHVIINPGAGQPQPVLHILNSVFQTAGVDWDVALTKDSGDAERMARQAAASGVDVVAAYGGDGTIMEVARGLMNSEVPLAILPGGTANLVSVELGIPKDLELAARIACNRASPVRLVDVGQVMPSIPNEKDTQPQYFMLRVSLGYDVNVDSIADRRLKDRYGMLAYSIAGLKALETSTPVPYKFVLDGVPHEVEGFSCMVDNAGNMGVSGFNLAAGINVSDGLLDVIVVRDRRFRSFVAVGSSIAKRIPNPKFFHHWQARHIEIATDRPHQIAIDGELSWNTPVSIQVLPHAVRVLTLN